MPSPETSAALSGPLLATLASAAAAAVVAAVKGGTAPLPPDLVDAPRAQADGASFVTLTRHGRLRGCIGSLEPRRALLVDVVANARAAACDDPRFPPLSVAELDSTDLEVSVLSPAQALPFDDESTLLETLRPGVDGIVIQHHGRRATFLPSVWTQLPRAADFIAQLRRKAGIDDAVPLTAIAVARYTTQHSARRPLLAT